MQRLTDRRLVFRYSALSLVCLLSWVTAARAAAETVAVSVAENQLSLQVPADWTRKQPTVRIIEHEFQAPAADGAAAGGRLTMMSAGGSVQANIDRWKGQFQLAADHPPKIEKMEANGLQIHWVDLRGTYKDQAGPFAPAQTREDYRMLGAVIEVKSGGLYFIKFYGPSATIEKHAAAFQALIQSVTAK